MRQPIKDVVVNGQKFQIRRMDAMTGSWIAMQLVTKLFPFNLEQMMGMNTAALPVGRSELSEVEFRNIQGHCLRVCDRYDEQTSVAIPILMVDGRFAVKELETDVITVLGLTAHALVFNIGPFFEEGALKPLLESFSSLNLLNAPQT